MMLNLNLPNDAEKRLRQQAASAGKDVATFVREAIEEKLAAAETVASNAGPSSIRTPRLSNPAQAGDFAKEVIEGAGHAKV